MKTLTPFIIMIYLLNGYFSTAQTLIALQSFEDDGDTWPYYANPTPFTDADAVWNILGSGQIGLQQMPIDGSQFWGIKDLNSPSGTSSWGVISFSSLDLSNFEDVVLSFIYECLGFDSGDDMKYQLKLNGWLQAEVLLVDGFNNLNVFDTLILNIPDTVHALELSISVKQNGTTDYAGIDHIQLHGSEIIPNPEPDEHANNVHQTNAKPFSVEISWNTPQGSNLPDYYLFQISLDTSFQDPEDGVEFQADMDILDGTLALHIPCEINQIWLEGLSVSTTYWLRIIPYSNSGSLSDYKLDGDIPLIQVSTFRLSDIFFSEVADPADQISARFVELYNRSDFDLNLSNPAWYLCKQTNGSTWSCTPLQGTIESQKTFTIANSSSSYLLNFETLPNQVSSSIISGNGNDTYALYFGGNYSSGTLVDIFGQMNTDGLGTFWDYTDAQAVRKLSVQTAQTIHQPNEWLIELGNASQCHPGFYGSIFTGLHNQYWHEPDNWKPGPPPVNGNVWVRNSALNNLTIDLPTMATNLILDPNRNIDGFHLLSLSGDFLANCVIPGWNEDFAGWRLLSSPMAEVAIANSDFTIGDYDFYLYDESQNLWLNQKNPQHASLFEQFIPGKAYLVAYDTTRVRTFKGQLTNQTIPIEGLSKLNHGWHLVGNPFPTPIIWGTEEWSLTGVSPFAYTLNESGTAYELLFPGDTIEKFEGFWVKAGHHNASLDIPLPTLESKSTLPELRTDDLIQISLSGDAIQKKQLWIKFSDLASFDYHYIEDATYLNPLSNNSLRFYIQGNDSSCLFYSSQPYEVQQSIRLIAVGKLPQQALIQTKSMMQASQYTFASLRYQNNPELFLPDASGSILLTTDTSSYQHKFELHFEYQSDQGSLTSEINLNFMNRDFSFLIRSEEIPVKTEIYDLTGRLIQSNSWPTMPTYRPGTTQFLILVLTTNQSQYSQTILLNP
jgi:hypothetical protein